MAEIKTLSSHLANLIAAGEVVERPASVVKELMENAIDAGARNIIVEIVRGGMGLIRVTDDGCGIPEDQAATAFLRHATSKISSEADLSAIGTLGFRGEALAAIAAVSRVELITRTEDAPFGIRLQLEGGNEISREEAGCPVGTTMIVRNLFFNTPARLKFMRKDGYEGGTAANVVQEIALSHPELAIKLYREGKAVISTPGDGKMMSTLYSIFGRDVALGFIEVKDTTREIQVEGFATRPSCCKPSRSWEHFFVNGRLVENRLMWAAMEQAYANQKLVGKFPGCVLYITMPTDKVDVNVHPTKSIVKFQNDADVFDAISIAVQAALERDHTMARFGGTPVRRPPAVDTVTDNQTYLPMGESSGVQMTMTPPEPASAVPAAAPDAPAASAAPAEPAAPAATSETPAVPEPQAEQPAADGAPDRPAVERQGVPSRTDALSSIRPPVWSSGPVFKRSYARQTPSTPQGTYHMVEPLPKPRAKEYIRPEWVTAYVVNPSDPNAPAGPIPIEEAERQERARAELDGQEETSEKWNPLGEIARVVSPEKGDGGTASEPVQVTSPFWKEKPPEPWVVRGEIFRTYVIVEQGDKVIFIDKHAAHERLNFDNLKAEDYKPMVQELLMPVTFRPSPIEREILLENISLLKQYGFELEEYGDASVAVRAAPDYLEEDQIASTLLEVAEKIRTTGRGNPENARDELLHSLACKAAIKGGWWTGDAELQVVARLVMSGQVKYCPHGRPVSITLSKSKLEKEFKR